MSAEMMDQPPSKSNYTPAPAEVVAEMVNGRFVESRTRDISCQIGLPPEGAKTAMRPTELLMSALAGCALANLAITCSELGLQWQDLRVRLRNEDASDPSRIAKITMEIDAPVIDPAMHSQLTDAVRAGSRIYNTLTRGIEVDFEILSQGALPRTAPILAANASVT